MKRLMGITILGAAVGVAGATAQPAEEGRGRGRHGIRAVVEYLDLTQEQQDRWKALHEQHRDEMKTLREEGRDLGQKLRAALEADEPDAVVGEAAKAVHAHRKLVTRSRETLEGQLKSVLTPEQQERFEAFKAARALGRKGRGARGPRGSRGDRPVES